MSAERYIPPSRFQHPDTRHNTVAIVCMNVPSARLQRTVRTCSVSRAAASGDYCCTLIKSTFATTSTNVQFPPSTLPLPRPRCELCCQMNCLTNRRLFPGDSGQGGSGWRRLASFTIKAHIYHENMAASRVPDGIVNKRKAVLASCGW